MFKKKKNLTFSEFEQQPITNVLGSDVKLTGDIKGDFPIRIDGMVEGNVHVEKGVVLGEKSIVLGNVCSDFVIVYGKLHGDVEAKNLYIKNTGTINGSIRVDMIEIEAGGRYNGNLQMSVENLLQETVQSEHRYLN
jgi:cytoskeletal protein CcmA (bactofilin family)